MFKCSERPSLLPLIVYVRAERKDFISFPRAEIEKKDNREMGLMSKSTKSVFGVVVGVTMFFLIMAGQAEAVNFLYQTPTGNTWQQINRECNNLRNKLPADGGPRTSAEGQRRVNVMRQIVTLYDRGNTLFSRARTVTKQREAERRWYNYMANSCRIHASNWNKNAQHMLRITNSLRKQGR